MNTYEITFGVFLDSHTTGAVEYHSVQAQTLNQASHLAEELKLSPRVPAAKNTYGKGIRREICKIERIA